MKEKSSTFVPQPTSVDMTSPVCNSMRSHAKKSAIAVCPVQNRKMTLSDKSATCVPATQIIELLKILAVDSTSNEKDLRPYWNKSCLGLSQKLLLLTKIDSADLVLKSSKRSPPKTLASSWFSTQLNSHPRKNSYRILSPSSMFSPVGSTDSVATVVRSRKIRLFPEKTERERLRRWFGAARWFFNETVALLRETHQAASRFKLQQALLHNCPEWAANVPYKIKQMAIEDACSAVRAARKKNRSERAKPISSRRYHRVHFRKRKERHDSCYIPVSAVYEHGVYPRLLGSLNPAELIGEAQFDCRLSYQHGRYYLTKPEARATRLPENQRQLMVALDPGVRTFISFWSPEFQGKVGAGDFGRIYRLCHHLDNLIARMSKASSKQWRAMRKAADRLRWKIKDLVNELHHKTAHWLCKTFDTICIPPFEVQQMVSKLRSETARAMLTWAHYRFRSFLQNKAQEYGCTVVLQNEAYTSKTCSFCGNITEIGSAHRWTCPKCKRILDRDLNGARGIFLRALVDHPTHRIAVCANATDS